jgi:hypothetical protein
MNKPLLVIAAIVALSSTAWARDVRHAVCVGPVEHYGHDSETNMRVWRDSPSGEVLYECEWESNTPSGRLIQKACGPIVDVVDENLKLVCRIEGLFEVFGGKVKLSLIRAENVKVVRK